MKKHLPKLIPAVILALAAGLVGVVLGGTGTGTAATTAKPTNTRPPTISGKAQVGQTLTANEGQWTGNPTDFDYSWRRCDADGGSCSLISGANQKTYLLKDVDKGNTLRVRVTAQNADGNTVSTSVPTAVVTEAPTPPPASNCDKPGGGTVAIGDVKSPNRLLVDKQSLDPNVVGGSSQQLVARFHVTACNGKSVQGALVYVTAVPYNQFSIPAEAPTGGDGWAELRMNRLRGFPAANRQQLLVMFVRAREPGGNVLGGISTRRLVSFPVNLGR
ncbi:MAG TPA: hypothetical protein VL264_02030 [Gaiella sp.]|jgi:hypothetical protein|nr:hypothetical protein [Gaiella sp.]